MNLSWVACEARTGRVVAELRDLVCPSVSAVLGGYTTATATLPLPTAPENWESATTAGGSFLVLLDGDVPVWGGLVMKDARSEGDTKTLPLATLEAYFDRRFVGDETYTATGQNAIVADLAATYLTSLPIRVEYTGPGTLRDRTYEAAADKTLLSVLTELMGVIGGPEWTVGWEHQSDPERFTPVLYVGDRIGVAPSAGMAPAATFELPGSIVSVEYVSDWSSGKGATDVMAVSSATAGVRPESPHQTVTDPTRLIFEHRFTPSTSITEVATLTSHAQRTLAALSGGTRSLAFSANVDAAPRLGTDWRIGDDVGYVLNGPAFPGGWSGSARAVGWELSLTEPLSVSPVLSLEV